MRPNNDIVEFHIILQNYQLVFEILPNGNVNLIEKVIKGRYTVASITSGHPLNSVFSVLVADIYFSGLQFY